MLYCDNQNFYKLKFALEINFVNMDGINSPDSSSNSHDQFFFEVACEMVLVYMEIRLTILKQKMGLTRIYAIFSKIQS